MASSHQPLSLTVVAEGFKQWRTSGKNRQRVPDELRQQAVALLSSYSKNEIVKAIGTNHSMLTRWAKDVDHQHHEEPVAMEPEFVSLPVIQTADSETLPVTKSAPSPILTMVHTSGWTLQWHTLPDNDQLHRLLSTIQQVAGVQS